MLPTCLMALLLALLQGSAEPDLAPRAIEVPSMSHPFLFFSAEDVPALRAAAGTERKAQFGRLQAWGELFTDLDPLPPATRAVERIPVGGASARPSTSADSSSCTLSRFAKVAGRRPVRWERSW